MPAKHAAPENSKIWIFVFIFGFFVLLMDGADLMFLSYSLEAIVREFSSDILCQAQAVCGFSEEDAKQIIQKRKGMLGTYTLIGMAIGGIYGGWAADRFGRVKTVVFCVLVFSVGTGLLGVTKSYNQFALFRLVAALGLGAAYVTCNTLMAEYVPTKYRTTVLGTLQAGWSVGYLVATLLARWIIPEYGWRPLFYVGFIPVAIALIMQFIVPEPKAWIEANARRLQEKASAATQQVKKAGRSAYAAIFKDPEARRMFLLWSATAGLLQFGYYGIGNWMPNYLQTELKFEFKTMTTFMVGSYTAMILGKILAGWAADLIGRRAVYAIGGIGAAVMLPIIVIFASKDNIIVLMTIFGFIYGIPYGVNATYMTESFSTKIRGTAVGGAYNVGRVMAALAPITIGYLAAHYSIGAGFLVVGVAYFLCGLLPALFIREKLYDPQSAK
ncbi:MAG: MFS transporter [Xanthomonadaceae bacterium]|jgi:AAHS family cis,cis-muconate transporter-like MFS transporter|nr:MFS transporter [Xanthomonadaceae bacterium]